MKHIFMISTILVMVSCASYKELVSVQSRQDIPRGTTAIILSEKRDEQKKENKKSEAEQILTIK